MLYKDLFIGDQILDAKICFNPWFDGLLYKDHTDSTHTDRQATVSTLDLMDCYIKTIAYLNFCFSFLYRFNPWFDGLLYKDCRFAFCRRQIRNGFNPWFDGLLYKDGNNHSIIRKLKESFNPWFDGLLYKDLLIQSLLSIYQDVSTLDLMDCYIKTFIALLILATIFCFNPWFDGLLYKDDCHLFFI